jgi:hypothetical protein
MSEDQKKYLENVAKYNLELYEKLVEASSDLNDDDEAEKYVKFLLVSTAQESIFKIKEAHTHAMQLFNHTIELPEKIESMFAGMKSAFSIQNDELVNVSGMTMDKLIEFIKESLNKDNGQIPNS